MMEPTKPERRRDYWSAPRERIMVQAMHWFVVLCVIGATVLLAVRHDLDSQATAAILSLTLGHVGTSAAQKVSTRSTDRDDDRT